jgi:hypothetical protein
LQCSVSALPVMLAWKIGDWQIDAIANDFDGFSGIIPKSSATDAEVLKAYGYNTAAFGKWQNTPEEQISIKGPFGYWPTGYGFEYFYGFLASEASQYEPTMVRNTAPVNPHEIHRKGYHLTETTGDGSGGVDQEAHQICPRRIPCLKPSRTGQAVKSTPEILPLCMGAQVFFRQHPVAIRHKIQKVVLRLPRSANLFRFALE